MEASKETLDNLIVNASKTIAYLYSKLSADNRQLASCDKQMPAVVKLMLELRRDISFIVLDLIVSARACLNSGSVFEKCYHIKNLEGIRVEGYQLLCGYGKEKGDAIWVRMGRALQECLEMAEDVGEADIFSPLVRMHAQITPSIDAMAATDAERTSRNLTYHYDDELLKLYGQLQNKREEGEDVPIRQIFPWMDALLMIIKMCDEIEQVEAMNGYRLPEGRLIACNRSDAIAMHLYKRMASRFEKTENLTLALDTPLNAVCRLDENAMQKRKLLWLREFLMEKLNIDDSSAALMKLTGLFNIEMLITITFADVAAIMKAFLKAETDIEHALTLRRLVVTKVSALGHLVGYNEGENKSALWNDVQAAVPDGDVALAAEAQDIRQDLVALVNTGDVARRGLYVHFMDRYSHKSHIPEIISNLQGLDLMVEFHSVMSFIGVLGRMRKFLASLLKTIAEAEDKKARRTEAEFRAMIDRWRRLSDLPNVPTAMKVSVDAAMSQLDELLNKIGC